MVHVKIPYDVGKNLGKVYNQAFEDVDERDWVCLIDHDVMFLTPDAIGLMNEYTRSYPETGIFTCFTNRIHPLATDQLLDGKVSENTDMQYHVEKAHQQKRHGIKVTPINHMISGFLMLVSKKTWNQIKFPEQGKCLGVDNFYSQAILDAGKKIYRMDSLYVFHLYRLKNGIKDKSHLQ